MNWTGLGSSAFPFAKLAFAGTFLLASVGLVTTRTQQPAGPAGVYQLVLHSDRGLRTAEMEYLGSQWNHDLPVLVTHDASDGKVLEFHHRWPYIDGCYWESTETLTPVSPTRYRYVYTDHAVSCDDEYDTGIETVPSPLSGYVDVVAVK